MTEGVKVIDRDETEERSRRKSTSDEQTRGSICLIHKHLLQRQSMQTNDSCYFFLYLELSGNEGTPNKIGQILLQRTKEQIFLIAAR